MFALGVLGLAFAASAQKSESPQRDAALPGAAGSFLQFQEGPSGNVLYFEEKGGLILPNASPVAGSKRDPLPANGEASGSKAPVRRNTRRPVAAPAVPAKPQE